MFCIVFLVGCTKQETKYVCQDGTIVKDASQCPIKQDSFADKVQEKPKCQVSSQGFDLPNKCEGLNGLVVPHSGAYCDEENIRKTPSKSGGMYILEAYNLRCENNMCIYDTRILKDCTKYDTDAEYGFCAIDPITNTPDCFLIAKDGSYVKEIN